MLYPSLGRRRRTTVYYRSRPAVRCMVRLPMATATATAAAVLYSQQTEQAAVGAYVSKSQQQQSGMGPWLHSSRCVDVS